MEQEVAESVRLNKMDYELWIETASDFTALRQSLIARGYRNIGLQEPMMNPEPITKIVGPVPKSYKVGISNKPRNMMKRGKR